MRSLLVMFLVLCTSVVSAGELGISWDQVAYTHPITYEVFRDDAPIGQTPATSLLVAAPDNCFVATYTVTAEGGGQTSDPSEAIQSMARPTVASILFNAGGVHQITGQNFPVDVQVLVDGVPVTTGLDRQSCQLVEIPTTAGTPSAITIINPQADGQLSVTWLLPPPIAPANVGAF